MPKILMVTTIPSTICAFLLPFAAHLRKLGWQVDAMAQGIAANAECVKAFDRVINVQWSRNPLELSNFFATPQAIQEIINTANYDIIHVHTPVAAFVTRYALKNLKQRRLKVIYTAHGFHFHPRGTAWKNAIFLQLEKMAGRWTDYLVTINQEDYTAAKRHQLLPADRVRYMPGIGVDIEYYNPQSVAATDVEKVRAELGLQANTPLFLSVAEFTPRKHHRDMLQAVARLARPDVHLALAGDGRLFAEMQQLATELGVAPQVHFLGNRRDIPVLMRASLATMLVSEQEGLPRSVMESLALEVAVIGTKIRGIQELLEDGCGLLVEVGQVTQLAEAMAWALAHPDQIHTMGKKGRDRMAAFALPEIVKLYEELYTEAIS